MAARSKSEFSGVLLAAGRARRMGSVKQLLPVQTASGATIPMVAAACDLLAPYCNERVVVVTGHEAAAVAAALAPRRFVQAASDPDADMFHSVKIGLARARRAFPTATACWLHLADHPFVLPDTARVLCRAFDDAGDRAILPEHLGRGGHPVIIPARVVDEILAWSGDGGLRAFWLAHPERCRRVPTDDPGTVRDIDTPEDYRPAT
jgi:molybdenum cofactor cytidylyltransferase